MNILPTKHISPSHSLLVYGAELLELLDHPQSITRLWTRARETLRQVNFDTFIVSLVLLFAVGAVEYIDGKLRTVSA